MIPYKPHKRCHERYVCVCVCLDGILSNIRYMRQINRHPDTRPTGHSLFEFLRDLFVRSSHKGITINWIVLNIMICILLCFFLYLFSHQFFWRLCGAINILFFPLFLSYAEKNNIFILQVHLHLWPDYKMQLPTHNRQHINITFMMVNEPFILIFHSNSLCYFC